MSDLCIIVHGIPGNMSQKALIALRSQLRDLILGFSEFDYMGDAMEKNLLIFFPRDMIVDNLKKGTVAIVKGTFRELKKEHGDLEWRMSSYVESVLQQFFDRRATCFIDLG